MTQQLNDVRVTGESKDRRRAEPRVACDREISIIPATEGDATQFDRARVTDCSPNGMGLVLNERVEAGQQILAKLDVDRHPTLLMYTVRYCIPMQTDQYRAGLRFSGFIASKFRGQLNAVMSSLALNGR
jgi:c-di-GMP-binding flagellar brake protein YcgR